MKIFKVTFILLTLVFSFGVLFESRILAQDVSEGEERFTRGNLDITAKVSRRRGNEVEELPLYRVPSLNKDDYLNLRIDGNIINSATGSRWSVVVAFFPGGSVPFNNGYVRYRITKENGTRLIIPPIKVPYNSVPMIFIVPSLDNDLLNKIKEDISQNYNSFAEMSDRIPAFATRRSWLDKFLTGLDSIPQNQDTKNYQSKIQRFATQFGVEINSDCLKDAVSNTQKAACASKAFREQNLKFPNTEQLGTLARDQLKNVKVNGVAISPYVQIALDVYFLFKRLFPSKKYTYLPTLAKEFEDGESKLKLYYDEAPVTVGSTRGALVYTPSREKDLRSLNTNIQEFIGGCLRSEGAKIRMTTSLSQPDILGSYGRDWKLLVSTGQQQNLPAFSLDSDREGNAFIIRTDTYDWSQLTDIPSVSVKLNGSWGFDNKTSPSIEVPVSVLQSWKPTSEEQKKFVVKGTRLIRISGNWNRCIQKMTYEPETGVENTVESSIKEVNQNLREFSFNLEQASPSNGNLKIYQYGVEEPSPIPFKIYPEAPKLTAKLHQNDSFLTLNGSGLEQIKSATLNNISLKIPSSISPSSTSMILTSEDPLNLVAGSPYTLTIKTENAETKVSDFVKIPRPLIADQIETSVISVPQNLKPIEIINSQQAISQDSIIRITINTKNDYLFTQKPKIQIRNQGNPNQIFQISDNSILMLPNNKRLIVTFKPSELLGGNALGKLEVLVSIGNEATSDAKPLSPIFIQLPIISGFKFAVAPSQLCTLYGVNLQLIDETASAFDSNTWNKVSITDLGNGSEETQSGCPTTEGYIYSRLLGYPDIIIKIKPNLLP